MFSNNLGFVLYVDMNFGLACQTMKS
jgi:hypothetical protein